MPKPVVRFLFTCLLLAPLASLAQPIVHDQPPPSPESIDGVTKVSAEEMIDLVGSADYVMIIDSRIRSDREQGFIEGSISLPDRYTDCDSLSVEVIDRSVPVVFYCNGPKCGRSARAVQIAQQCGYSSLYWFRGGMEEWNQKGYPVVH